VPYLYNDNIAIGYDDTESIEYKLNYAIDNQLGGVSIFSLDYDDASGFICSSEANFTQEYPLLNKVYQILFDKRKNCSIKKRNENVTKLLKINNNKLKNNSTDPVSFRDYLGSFKSNYSSNLKSNFMNMICFISIILEFISWK